MKSLLYAANTGTQIVASTGSVVNMGSVVRKFGCNFNMSGGNLEVTGVGYYPIIANLTVTASAAGAATIQLYKDGVVIEGAEAVATISAANDSCSVSIPASIRLRCNCTDTITAEVSGLNGSVTNAAILAMKA